MKKKYLKPVMRSVTVKQRMSILAGTNPNAHDEKGSSIQFSRESSGWGDDED